MQRPEVESHVTLSDGRRLGYAEFGDLNGVPLLWFPGLPGCCRFAHPTDVAITRRCKVRLIVVERPGFGISDFKPGRTLLDYARDVAELADSLGLERFCIAGVSGGGPSLAACAYALPERVIAVGMIGCGGPPDAPGALDGMAAQRRRFAALYRHTPMVAAKIMKLARLDRNPERFYRLMMQGMAKSDALRVSEPEIWRDRIDHVREAMRQGTRGFAWELHTFLKPWGFELSSIRVPVELWHGEADRSTPIGMGRYLAETIPNVNARFLPDEGHFLCYDHFAEILSAVTAHARRTTS